MAAVAARARATTGARSTLRAFIIGSMLGGCSTAQHRDHFHLDHTAASAVHYDAMLLPCGGLDADSRPLPFVRARLDEALKHDKQADFYVVLGRGTTHTPPPLDDNEFPIDEAVASARYLFTNGVKYSRVYEETWSLDTIGNALFTRLMHVEPRGWSKLLVITSDFHMKRVQTIFNWVFALPPHPPGAPPVELSYISTPDVGLDGVNLNERNEKEQEALGLLIATMQNITDMSQLHKFIFSEHAAYAPRPAFNASESEEMAETYGAGAVNLSSSHQPRRA